MKHLIWIASLCLLIAGSYLCSLKNHTAEIAGFHPARNDSLAKTFAPGLRAGEYGIPERLLYRMSEASDGSIHIAYFFVWPYERNDSPGIMPWLSRTLYTDGLSLQGILFGPGDVEVIYLVLERNSGGPADGYRIKSMEFETAGDYDPRDFGVSHLPVQYTFPLESASDLRAAHGPNSDFLSFPGSRHLIFRVISWNHMFEWEPASRAGAEETVSLRPEYFSEEDWNHFGMFKPVESIVSRNRAHPEFAREAVPISIAPKPGVKK
ncbi:MAG TPA: hypothetical protein DEA96_07060 [Leptospiraceae bacterium]|nr:hypothetical protein [Spirochaetaceae bacterium]HBS04704.1 hypothetical protein [Leptospiraceae bacterium]|tara:strand:+ start:3137 stop:3931 length:795 start_codon:yes stop_codon:yes gene_type:complete